MVEKIFLFGSHARGIADENSDIDLLVISRDFGGMDLYERLSLLGRARKGIPVPMDIIGYTEEEIFSKDEESFVKHEAIGMGVEIPRAT